MEGLVAGRRADRGRHEGIPSKDRRRVGADAGAWSIDVCDATLLRGIANKVAVLSCRTIARVKVRDNVWEMETLVGSARGDGRGGGRSGSRNGYLLDRIIAEVVGDGGTLFFLRRSHKDEDGQKHE